MIELNKKFESDDELAIYCARVLDNYCRKVGKCENCAFGLNMGNGVKNACVLATGQLPCTWELLMKCCGVVIKDE